MDPAARTATSKVEPGAPAPGVEHDGDVLARRVLELFHHEPAAARRRAPVHLAQGVALDVVAHAVQVESGRPLEEESPAAAGARARLGEEPFEVHEARVDDERRALAERQLAALEAERILDDGRGPLDAVAAARHGGQDVAGPEAAAFAPELDAALAEPGVARRRA